MKKKLTSITLKILAILFPYTTDLICRLYLRAWLRKNTDVIICASEAEALKKLS